MSETRSTVSLGTTRDLGHASVVGAGASAIEVPRRIGPVELIKQVGEGGMGVVWRARHEVLARDVAVKFLLEVGGDDGAKETFVQGARAAAMVRHAGLTAVHDAGVVQGVPYLIMEYVDGPTLGQALRRGGLSMEVVRAVLVQVCAAVGELHEHDLVHRDIKPSNIMVDKAGRVLVTDFGLSCPRSVRGKEDGEAKKVAGTPVYMAPEMFEGEVTVKTDVYAIGATAFELLCGGPVREGGVLELRAAAQRGELARERLVKRGVPEGVIEVIERCMNKDALYRPKNARRAGEAFERAFEEAVPSVRAATERDLRGLAFPSEREDAAAMKSGEVETPLAPTIFGLLSTMAEKKRMGDSTVEGASEMQMRAPVEPPPIARVWPAGMVCRGCGYALEGLSATKCPECGAAVGPARGSDRPGSWWGRWWRREG